MPGALYNGEELLCSSAFEWAFGAADHGIPLEDSVYVAEFPDPIQTNGIIHPFLAAAVFDPTTISFPVVPESGYFAAFASADIFPPAPE